MLIGIKFMSLLDYKNKKIILEYDTKTFNFSELFISHLSKLFKINSLHDLHLNLPSELLPQESVSEENDQSLAIYESLYAIDKGFDLNSNKKFGVFLNKYKKFVNYLSSSVFEENNLGLIASKYKIMLVSRRVTHSL